MRHIELNLIRIISTCPGGISRVGLIAADYLYGDDSVVKCILSQGSSVHESADATLLIHLDSAWNASAEMLQKLGVKEEPICQVCVQAEDAAAQIEAFLRKLGEASPNGAVLNIVGPEESFDQATAEYVFHLFLKLFVRMFTTRIKMPNKNMTIEEATTIRDPFSVWDQLERFREIQAEDYVLPDHVKSLLEDSLKDSNV
jgi:hypothetical protein